MKQCVCCGASYTPHPKAANKIYCSPNCRVYAKERNCDYCNRLFRPLRLKKEKGNRTGRFCSTTCAGRWAAENKSLALTATKKCQGCGASMKRVHFNRLFCSVKCRNQPKVLPCEQCGRSFTSTQVAPGKPRSRFCGVSCRKNWSGRWSARRRIIPTPEEMTIWKMFPDSILRHHIRTEIRKTNNARRWYQIDVAFPEIKLGVEIDGGVHRIPANMEKDRIRTKYLEAHGWTVLRFWNHEVIKDSMKVKRAIQSTISKLRVTQVIP